MPTPVWASKIRTGLLSINRQFFLAYITEILDMKNLAVIHLKQAHNVKDIIKSWLNLQWILDSMHCVKYSNFT